MTATAAQRLACEQSQATQMESTLCLLSAFHYLGVPFSLIDLGCGIGHLCDVAVAIGAPQVLGVDISLPPEPEVRPAGAMLFWGDLSKPWRAPFDAEMVLCLEVAEHLPPEAADTLCDSLAGATRFPSPDNGPGSLLFSAATPGQGGSGHLNEQPHDYWREKLLARRFVENAVGTERLRRTWSRLAPNAWWYGGNVMVFEREAR